MAQAARFFYWFSGAKGSAPGARCGVLQPSLQHRHPTVFHGIRISHRDRVNQRKALGIELPASLKALHTALILLLAHIAT
ncbi:MAG TPA: hypothetical protein DEF05_00680 [Erwinia sp.]|nr:hypothetical protein [Erwinia sp.]